MMMNPMLQQGAGADDPLQALIVDPQCVTLKGELGRGQYGVVFGGSLSTAGQAPKLVAVRSRRPRTGRGAHHGPRSRCSAWTTRRCPRTPNARLGS